MQIRVTLIGISRFFSADEIENLVITAAEAFCGQLDHLSTRQRDLATRAHALLTADSMPTSAPAAPAEPAAEVWFCGMTTNTATIYGCTRAARLPLAPSPRRSAA